MFKRALIAVMTAALLAVISAPAMAQKIELRSSDVHPPDYPTVRGVMLISDLMNQWTNGRITIKVFHSSQLGAEKEALEMTQLGALDMTRVSVGPVGPIVDELNVFNMPYLFRDSAHQYKVLDGPIGDEMLSKLEAGNLIGLGWYAAGSRSFYNSKRPIKNIDDLKGLKFRVMGNPLFVDMMQALGGNGVSMAHTETYSALQTGVVDGGENNFPTYDAANHYQVAKYYTLDEHLMVPEIIVFSKKKWDTLSKEDQGLLRKATKESVAMQRKWWAERELVSRKKVESEGSQVVETIDKTPFVKAVQPMYEKSKYAALIKRIQAVP